MRKPKSEPCPHDGWVHTASVEWCAFCEVSQLRSKVSRLEETLARLYSMGVVAHSEDERLPIVDNEKE